MKTRSGSATANVADQVDVMDVQVDLASRAMNLRERLDGLQSDIDAGLLDKDVAKSRFDQILTLFKYFEGTHLQLRASEDNSEESRLRNESYNNMKILLENVQKRLSEIDSPRLTRPSTAVSCKSKKLSEITQRMSDLAVTKLRQKQDFQKQIDDMKKLFDEKIREITDKYEREQLNIQLEEVDLRCRLDEVSENNAENRLTEHAPDAHRTPNMYLNPETKPFAPANLNNDMVNAVKSVCEATSSLKIGMDLPKPEIQYFSGEPCDYPSFMHSFKTNIELKVHDEALRLSYLIQFCKGTAKRAIQDLVLLPSEQGYKEAVKTLYGRYGRPHVIASSLVKGLTLGSKISSNDGDGLMELAMEMKRCQLTVSSLAFSSDIHNSDNLLKIMLRLPQYLQNKWACNACDIIDSGREPDFNDMAHFVYRSARVATTFYGRHLSSKSKQTLQPKRSVYSTQLDNPQDDLGNKMNQNYSECCPYCQCDHKLHECKTFKALKVYDRRGFMMRNQRCFMCFKEGHVSKGCLSNNRCSINDCGGSHDKLLHFKFSRRSNTVAANSSLSNSEANSCNTITQSNKVLLRVLPVKLVLGNKIIETNALLDCGSDVTLISKDLLVKLGSCGEKSLMKINTISSNKVTEVIKSSLTIRSISDDAEISTSVIGIQQLPDLSCNISTTNLSLWSHLKDISFPELSNRDVGILIGANVPQAFWVYEQRCGSSSEPYAIRTMLGWTVMGPTNDLSQNQSVHANHVTSDNLLETQLKRFWESDFPSEDDSLGMSREDEVALGIISKGAIKVNGHFQLPLPFKSNPSTLKDNFSMAYKRLGYLKRRFKTDNMFREKYVETVEKYISKGWAVPSTNNGFRYFIPHHAVTHARKPNKVRVVFDCAAQFDGQSLNDYLYMGPDLANNLLGVLLRFRKHPIAIAADIEAMYHQVHVLPEHRKYLSFLWWPGGNIDNEPQVYEMTVHIFGARSSPCCANYALKRTAELNADSFDNYTINSALNNFYVDDYLASVEDVSTAISLRRNIFRLVSDGGFTLTKWISNNRRVLESIPLDLQAPSVQRLNLDLDPLPSEGTLGMRWNSSTDTMELIVKIENKPLTRRGILSILSSVYDPLGVVVPFCIKAKILLQSLSRRKLSWDEQLSKEAAASWLAWVNDLHYLQNMKVPRCLVPVRMKNIKSIKLHVFCDASKHAYAAVSYLRIETTEEKVFCRFVIGKARLAPLKATTIPRLELSAAVLGVQLKSIVSKHLHLQVKDVVFWTDSSIVLQYISNEHRRFHVFVTNRLRKILEGSAPYQWRHVSSENNPADEATRGLSGEEMVQRDVRWINAPSFLQDDVSKWPCSFKLPQLQNDDPELSKPVSVYLTVQSTPLLKFVEYFSDLHKLLKSACWLLRFKSFIMEKKNVDKGLITNMEMLKTKHYLIQLVQRCYFPFINFSNLSASSLPKFIKKLSPMLFDGVIRVGGRLTNAPLEFEKRHPIILPNKCHFTNLVIQQQHAFHGHVGPSHTWALIRRSFWVVNGGVEVRKVLNNCLQCKRRNAKCGVQYMADLPSARVTPNQPPFCITGLDYFGPFLVKRGRSQEKRYGCIFTCLSSRAVHLEVAYSLDTAAFLNVLSRFMSRRGRPKVLYSDNGSNFVGAKRVLHDSIKEWNKSFMSEFMLQHEIEWHMNPPTASHFGGVWERLIRSVRKILINILDLQVVSDDVLSTVFAEVESILNSRPLIPLSVDSRDDEVLTPNHLLNVGSCSNLPPGLFCKEDNYSRNRWRQVQYLTEQFWVRWIRDYLPLLQVRQKWTTKHRNFAVGDVVLVADNRFPKRSWPLGIVHKTYPDRKGNIRQVDVKMKDGVFRRPINKLCLLESAKV